MSHLLSHISTVDTPAFLVDIVSRRIIFNSSFLRLKLKQLPVKEFHYLNDEELNQFFRIPELICWVRDCIERPRTICRTVLAWSLLAEPRMIKIRIMPLEIDDQIFVTGYLYLGDGDL